MPVKKHGMWNTPTYKTWQQMKDRCDNPKNISYPYYGGKGITYCSEWANFIHFLADMGVRPEGMSLDRVDNEVGYCVANCRWQTPKGQANNRTNNVRVLWDGQILTLNDLINVWGRPLPTVAGRVNSFFTYCPRLGLYTQTRELITRNRKGS